MIQRSLRPFKPLASGCLRPVAFHPPSPSAPPRPVPHSQTRRHTGHTHSASCSHSDPPTATPDSPPAATPSTPPRYAPSPEEVSSARSYLQTLLMQHDHPSYMLTPFIPPPARDAYLAIKSFNLDTAHVSDQTSNLAVARLRMRFWRDAIDALFSPTSPAAAAAYKEPTILLLSSVLAGTPASPPPRLNKGWFLRNISARESLLPQTPFATLEALEGYAESAYSSLYYLLLESLHIHSTTLDHIAGHIGKAAGISAILRGVPLTAFPSPPAKTADQFSPAQRGAVLLPLDICAKHGLRGEDVLRHGGAAEGLKDVVFEVATRANDHLLTARVMLAEARKKGEVSSRGGDWGVLLGAVPTGRWLGRLEGADFDVFERGLGGRDWKLPIVAWWAWRRGVF